MGSLQKFSYAQAQQLAQVDSELADAMDKVRDIDFMMLSRKLIEEKGWTADYCSAVEDLYRKFLALNARYPGRKICPSGPIDDFWHAHILDTQAYMTDCKRLFGEYLHHFPYFGMRGAADRANLEAAFQDSMDLFVLHFGIDPTAGDSQERSCSPQRCP